MGIAFLASEYSSGMTLRDWFAGHAMAGVIVQCAHDPLEDGQTHAEKFAARCYEIADAMLAARKVGSEREAKLMGDLDVLTAEVERLRAICRDVPAALNSAFAAGTEECEGGSARRQEKALAPVDGMRRRIRAALASEPRA